ncbi:MAG: hypothetical protein Q9M22_05890 [Mariprofundaceae bacterium]|nr:hypothetical protein [Mariprofundaceae bacterium]
MPYILSLLCWVLLVSCTDDAAWSPPPQVWQDLTIRVESRPVIPSIGNNEFLIIANRQQRGFINDLLIHVHSNHSSWKQAIPDGALGVFRRSVPIKDPAHDQLFVRLKRGDQEGELVFNLTPTTTP